MAKTVKCAFCGKEMVSGFFKGEDNLVEMGDEYIRCCDDCYHHYHLDDRTEMRRFNVKMANFKKANKIRKLSQEETLALYLNYFKQMQAYPKRSATVGKLNNLGYFHANDDGYFCTTEF